MLPNKKQRPVLGARVKFVAKNELKRYHGHSLEEARLNYLKNKIAETTTFSDFLFRFRYTDNETEGVYIGYRTVREGVYRESYGVFDDDEYRWIPARLEVLRYLEVWLIVTDPRKNFVCVFPEDCEVL